MPVPVAPVVADVGAGEAVVVGGRGPVGETRGATAHRGSKGSRQPSTQAVHRCGVRVQCGPASPGVASRPQLARGVASGVSHRGEARLVPSRPVSPRPRCD